MIVSNDQVKTEVEVRFLSPSGILQYAFDTFTSLEYARSVGQEGWLTCVVPHEAIPFAEISRDARIEVVRQVDDKPAYLEMDTQWLVRKWKKSFSGGERLITTGGPAALNIVARRIVAYYSGSSYASKEMAADDMMKEIIYENFVSPTDAARKISAYLSAYGDTTAGPLLKKAFSRDNVLTVLQEISAASIEAGTPIYFDVVKSGGVFQFRTYVGQRGKNRGHSSSAPFTFSPDRGNITNCEIEYDCSDEITYAYAGGQQTGVDRIVGEYGDSERIAASPLGRIEDFVWATNSGVDLDMLNDDAMTAVNNGGPKITMSGEIVQTPDSRYGVEWGWGDIVVQNFDEITMDVLVNNVRVSIKDGKEEVKATTLSV